LQKRRLIDDIRRACLEKGFFQLTGHGVPTSLQAEIFAQSADFFALPEEEKMKSDKSASAFHKNQPSRMI
jgi:isopenicillin N synthase-like dioxygenase